MPADPLSLDAVCRDVAALAVRLRPNAAGCRIVIDVPDGDGGVVQDTYSVPLSVPEAEDTEGKVLTVLGNLKPGAWIRGKSLAYEVDIVDPYNGNFRRVMARLTDPAQDGRVESDKKLGYRLKASKGQAETKGN